MARVKAAARSPQGSVKPLSARVPRPPRHWIALDLANAARRVVAVLKLWRERARSRAELADLDNHTLNDIGLTRIDVAREITKRFWM